MVQFLMWDVQGACSLALHSPSLRCSRVSFQGRNLVTIPPEVRSICGPSQQFPVYDMRKASVVSLILSSFLLSNTVCSQLLGTSSQRAPSLPFLTHCLLHTEGLSFWKKALDSACFLCYHLAWVGSFPCLSMAGFFHNITACSPVLFFLAFLPGHRLRDPSVFFISAFSATKACRVHSSCFCCQHMEIPVHSND